jgi:iron complex outermembrane receptor protein
MFQTTRIRSALLLAFGGTLLALAAPTRAADGDGADAQRVEITGSSIKRIDAETAVPVTVIKVDDLKKQGVTTIEQILQSVTAVQTSESTAQAIGGGTAGASMADMRGIGSNKTLVLLNGRRIANNAYDGSAPDLNMIPFAALERVEVLRDGASSLYGTDAIGGVINFITRKDFQGGSITLGADKPQHAGGAGHQFNAGVGIGDLNKDGVNVVAFLNYDKQNAIAATQRNYSKRMIGGASQTTYPGTYFYDDGAGGTAAYTPFAAPDCSAANHLYSISATQCGENTEDFIYLTPDVERVSALTKATVRINDDHTFGLEAFLSHDKVSGRIAATPYTGLTITKYLADGSLNPYFPGNGITPLPTGVTDVGDSVSVRYRDLVNGYRGNTDYNTQYRATANLEGTVKGWDYNTAVAINRNGITDENTHGYSSFAIIQQGIEDGIINPFGEQTAAGTALLQSAQRNGVLNKAFGLVQSVDGHASHEIGDWLHAGSEATIALGFEARRESFSAWMNTEYADFLGNDVSSTRGKRNVTAGFFELNVPILKTLDITLAARHDRYSDFGSTTNPKVSFRFQPSKSVLLRGSFSTGFRAPSLYELYSLQSWSITATTDDPEWCPGGHQVSGHPNACAGQFSTLTGGNTALKPERSKNATLGLVLEPIKDGRLEVDLWNIQFKNQIATLSASTILADPTLYAAYIHRNGAGDLTTDSTLCPGTECGYLSAQEQNLGDVTTNGIDVAASWRAPATGAGQFSFNWASTWVHTYKYQDVAGGEWTQNVGIYEGAGPVFRWQHNAGVTWALEPVTVTLAGHYKTGYWDEYEETDANGNDIPHKVSAFATFDLSGTWQVIKPVQLTLGVKNLFDREAPYTNQQDVFQTGYDPRFADATGRAFFGRATYTF